MNKTNVNLYGKYCIRVRKDVAKKLIINGTHVFMAMNNDNVHSPWTAPIRANDVYKTALSDARLIYDDYDEVTLHDIAFNRAENTYLYYNMGNGRGNYVKWYAVVTDVAM